MADASTTKGELEQAQARAQARAQAQEMGQLDDRTSRIDSVQVGNVDKPQEDGIYAEALTQSTDDSINRILEKKIRRKLDQLIIPLACNIFMWGALLMMQAAAKTFTDLLQYESLPGAGKTQSGIMPRSSSRSSSGSFSPLLFAPSELSEPVKMAESPITDEEAGGYYYGLYSHPKLVARSDTKDKPWGARYDDWAIKKTIDPIICQS
ncbi:hypothetical protein FGADI_8198 [Fusarium gaditjirri]|uniref:Uncharacterized protein n=1 Tax=Fusarium gaditjirri TaxID=282569 RepID=A0A8H4WUM9_9HYPO|nr:hypothetical protein FGADI_8198 [Fusarium gaditjirri]